MASVPDFVNQDVASDASQKSTQTARYKATEDQRLVSTLSSTPIEDTGATSAQRSLSTQIPLARIRRIMKEDEGVTICSSEVVTIISMATELFSEYLSKRAFEYSRKEKRKTLLLRDIARAVKETDDLFFLTDAIAELITSIEATKKERSPLDAAAIINEDLEEVQDSEQHDARSM